MIPPKCSQTGGWHKRNSSTDDRITALENKVKLLIEELDKLKNKTTILKDDFTEIKK